jgi:ribonuclease BN (tRNA processing enzyme)
VELITLGTSAAAPAAGEATAGHLVRHAEGAILLDCGSGVLAALLEVIDLPQLHAIVISHLHPDHYLDLVPLRYAVAYGNAEHGPRVFLPPGGDVFLKQLGYAIRGQTTFFHDVLALAEYDPDAPLAVAGFHLRFQRTRHDVPCFAIAVEGAARLVYTADTGPSEEVARFVAGADLLLCEATYPAEADPAVTAAHLRTVEAGELGRRAQRLVLTHFWPGYDREQLRQQAAAARGGPVELARRGARFRLGPDRP